MNDFISLAILVIAIAVVAVVVIFILHKRHSSKLNALVGKIDGLSTELKSQLGTVKAQVKDTQSKVTTAVDAAKADLKEHVEVVSDNAQAAAKTAFDETVNKVGSEIKEHAEAAAAAQVDSVVNKVVDKIVGQS